MARGGRRIRRRASKVRTLPEVDQFHLDQLRHLLRFLHATYESALGFWGDLLPLLFDRPLKQALELTGQRELKFYPDWDLEECLEWRKGLGEEFHRMIEGTKNAVGFVLLDQTQALQVTNWGGSSEIFWVGPYVEFSSRDQVLVRTVLRNAAQHLSGFRRDGLGRCDICGHYFLRSDIRLARYCSQPCRYRAFELKHEGKGAARAKRKKGG